MGKKRFLAVLLALSTALCVLCTQALAEMVIDETPYVVNLYNERNGLPTGEANAVLQTRDGYIWIGSYGGLICYNGSTFYNYSTDGILPTSSVRSLFEDSVGRLWIGTNDAGVFYLEDGELYHVENPNPKTYLCVRGFDEGEDGVIYIASHSGMGEIRNGTLIAYPGDYISGGTVYSVGEDSNGRVWGALTSGMCAVVQDGKALRIFSSDEFFDSESITCVTTDKAGRVYLGSSGSVMARLTFPNESLEPDDIEIKYIKTPGVTTHNSIVATDEGWIIVSGNVGSCVIGPEGSERILTAEDGASSVNIGCVDYEDNIWLASSNGGLFKYARGYFESPNKKAGLEGVAINAIVRENGNSYLGTGTGLLIYDENWQPVYNELTQRCEGARIRCMLADSQGRVWIAAYVKENPVICYNPADETMQIFTMEDGMVNSNARSLLELSDGRIAVGTQGGLNIIENGQVTEGFTAEDGVMVGSILCILESYDGKLLLGSDGGGIYEIEGRTVVNYNHEDGLEDGVVLRMIRDEAGHGYFISAGNSLYYWDESGFRRLPVRKGAGNIFAFFIRDDRIGLLQNNGIFTFDREQLLAGENPIPRTFSFAHGLTGSLEANTWSWQEEDGSLYLATREGISIFGFEPVIGTLPKGIISGVQVDDTFYYRPESVEIESTANRVTIDFAVLSFAETSDVGFVYMLEGFDEAETTSTAEKSGSISYTNLPGGEYTFRLRVFLLEYPNLYNDYSLSIVKEPKLMERMPVKVLMMALLVLFVVLVATMVYRAKIRGIQKRQRIYRDTIVQLMHTFARTIDARDSFADGHSLRVARYARELAKRMGKSIEEQENIYCVALLHDIGKVNSANESSSKAGDMSAEDNAAFGEHSQIDGDVLREISALQGIADGAKYHHVRYDGLGHRDQPVGEEIPLVARIIAVADAYDALSHDNNEDKGLSPDAIAEKLKKGSGTRFDPEIVSHMLNMIAEGVVPASSEE